MIRASCGTLAGALAHAAAGEQQCGWCTRAEARARLEAEGVPRRPPAAEPPPGPVTAAEAEANAAVLAAESEAHERRPRSRPAWLRVLPGAALPARRPHQTPGTAPGRPGEAEGRQPQMSSTTGPVTEQEIREAPVTGAYGRTPREAIERPRVKKGKLEVRVVWDVSGSFAEQAAPDSPVTKQELITEAWPHFVRLLEGDDAQAAREQAGGSSDKGGVRVFYANEPEPIEFADGEDESEDPRDGGDHNSANVREKMAQIPWGGRTYLMPAINAAEHASEAEARTLPPEERWDAVETLIITDGKVSDPGPFEAWLAHAGPRSVVTVAVIGYGTKHDEAVEHYQALADSNPFLTYAALTGVSDAEEAVLDLRLLSGTAPAS